LLLGGDLVGKTPLEVIRNAELTRLLEAADRSAEPIAGEVELGELKPRSLLIHAARLADDPGGLLVVFVDVTDLRRLESLRRDFVANVSHELRTPVTAVRTGAETLRRVIETRPETATEFIDIIERNAARLHQLVEDVLDLSKIESRELKLKLESVAVAAVASHVATLLRPTAERKQIEVRVEVPDDLASVRADRRALEQVLSNLVDNALKYGAQGGKVAVRAAPDGNRVRISVVDNGPGVEAKDLPRLFERFYRVDPGRSRDLGGTGLGLSIVKHLVEAMGGSVDVESTPGRGSTFWFALPTA
jgi:two-component system phosphate regulon sensor histidine kinase PhoR